MLSPQLGSTPAGRQPLFGGTCLNTAGTWAMVLRNTFPEAERSCRCLHHANAGHVPPQPSSNLWNAVHSEGCPGGRTAISCLCCSFCAHTCRGSLWLELSFKIAKHKNCFTNSKYCRQAQTSADCNVDEISGCSSSDFPSTSKQLELEWCFQKTEQLAQCIASIGYIWQKDGTISQTFLLFGNFYCISTFKH